LARLLDIPDTHRAALDVQFDLVEQILAEVRRAGITHAQLAGLAGVSRPRLTAILNGNLAGVSTDLLLRVLAALGVRVSVRFHRAA
jgi:predicted XRE-type DNA-binding protein